MLSVGAVTVDAIKGVYFLCQNLLADGRFLELILRYDADLARTARAAGCEVCGGVLHSAAFPRKPRGGPADVEAASGERLSFCCAVRDCRKRVTPPSVRFLGRKVYLGAVVVLATALRHGATPRRAARLRELFGVSARTLARWRTWWREVFAESPAWRGARSRFATPVPASALPASLLESRLRVKLLMDAASREELGQCLRHGLEKAGNPKLMTPELQSTLVEHAAGNYRALMTMANDLLLAGVQREVKQLDEKLFFEVFAPPPADKARPRPVASGRGR